MDGFTQNSWLLQRTNTPCLLAVNVYVFWYHLVWMYPYSTVSHACPFKQHVKMCVISPNCLNVFMHATIIIQAAKYNDNDGFMLNWKNIKLRCPFAWNRAAHKILQLELLFVHIVSNKAHFPWDDKIHLNYPYSRGLTRCSFDVATSKYNCISVFHIIYTRPTGTGT